MFFLLNFTHPYGWHIFLMLHIGSGDYYWNSLIIHRGRTQFEICTPRAPNYLKPAFSSRNICLVITMWIQFILWRKKQLGSGIAKYGKCVLPPAAFKNFYSVLFWQHILRDCYCWKNNHILLLILLMLANMPQWDIVDLQYGALHCRKEKRWDFYDKLNLIKYIIPITNTIFQSHSALLMIINNIPYVVNIKCINILIFF